MFIHHIIWLLWKSIYIPSLLCVFMLKFPTIKYYLGQQTYKIQLPYLVQNFNGRKGACYFHGGVPFEILCQKSNWWNKRQRHWWGREKEHSNPNYYAISKGGKRKLTVLPLDNRICFCLRTSFPIVSSLISSNDWWAGVRMKTSWRTRLKDTFKGSLSYQRISTQCAA